MFCEEVIKMDFDEKIIKNSLTDAKSKICKKFVKLLQNAVIMCYNAYTITTERDDEHEIYYCR